VKDQGQLDIANPARKASNVKPNGKANDVNAGGKASNVKPDGKANDINPGGKTSNVKPEGKANDVNPDGITSNAKPKVANRDDTLATRDECYHGKTIRCKPYTTEELDIDEQICCLRERNRYKKKVSKGFKFTYPLISKGL